MDDRLDLGRRGEALAEQHLRTAGYEILDRNVRTRYGEIDLVARDGACIVFVEVRTRRLGSFTPEESVGRRKQRQLVSLGTRYLQDRGLVGQDWRADVVAIEVDLRGRVLRLEHYVNAVEEQ